MTEPFSINVTFGILAILVLAVLLIGCLLVDLCMKVNKALGQNWEDNNDD
jgi:hypothetical protein